ncbi:unnamed protein product [Brassica oleracea var. botrytis]
MDGTTVFLRRDHRSEALGSLSVLQDETICVLLEYLDPRYIAYLSCVSITSIDEHVPQKSQGFF